MKKHILIIGGSHCCGYLNNAGTNDWIHMLSLDYDITVMALPGTSNQTCKLMLDHYLDSHSKPDHIIFEAMPGNRLDLGCNATAIPITDIEHNKRFLASRRGHAFECGCKFNEPDDGKPLWRSYICSDQTGMIERDKPELKKWIDYGVMIGTLPMINDYGFVETSYIKSHFHNIPFSWFMMNQHMWDNNKEYFTTLEKSNPALDISGFVCKSESPNHMSKAENIKLHLIVRKAIESK